MVDYHKRRIYERENTKIQSRIRKREGHRRLQLHSDQGFQYTSHGYYRLTKSYGITTLMSRRGNPYGNALAENFFSILKQSAFTERNSKPMRRLASS